jgi:hypothetical protein
VFTFDLLEQKENVLLKESMYLSTLTYLMSRHGQYQRNLVNVPEAQRKY